MHFPDFSSEKIQNFLPILPEFLSFFPYFLPFYRNSSLSPPIFYRFTEISPFFPQFSTVSPKFLPIFISAKKMRNKLEKFEIQKLFTLKTLTNCRCWWCVCCCCRRHRSFRWFDYFISMISIRRCC